MRSSPKSANVQVNMKHIIVGVNSIIVSVGASYDFDLDCDKHSVASYTIYPGPTYRVYNRHGSRKYPQR